MHICAMLIKESKVSQTSFFPPAFVLMIIILNIVLIIVLLIMLLKQITTAEVTKTEKKGSISSELVKRLKQQGQLIFYRSILAMDKESSIEILLDFITNTYMKMADGDGAVAFILDSIDDVMHVKAFEGFFAPAHALPEEVSKNYTDIEKHFKTRTFNFTDTLYGVLANTEKNELIINANHDSRVIKTDAGQLIDEETDEPLIFSADSYLYAPIKVDNVISAIIIISKKTGNGQFTNKNIDDLKFISEYSNLALTNVLAYSETSETENNKLQISIAKDEQKQLYLNKIPRLPHISVNSYFEPCEGVCSDYFDIITGGKNRVCILLADAVGKGLRSLLLMHEINSIMRVIAHTSKSASTLLQWINKVLVNEKKSDYYSSLSLILYDQEHKTIQCSNAEKNPFMIFKSANKTWENLNNTASALGVHKQSEYTDINIQLQKNDIILICTDGLVESPNEQGEQYTLARLKENIAKKSDSNAKEIMQFIKNDISNFTQLGVQHDDRSLVLIKVTD